MLFLQVVDFLFVGGAPRSSAVDLYLYRVRSSTELPWASFPCRIPRDGGSGL